MFPVQRPGQRVRVIPLQVETLPGGELRVSTPLARGWAATARTPHQLAHAVELAYREVAVASYTRAKGERYDLDALTASVAGDPLAGVVSPKPVRQRRPRRQSHPPAAWTKEPDGQWRSPSGLRYRPDAKVVQQVVAQRTQRGLPC